MASHREDADDHNLPEMIWFGLIPVARQAPESAIDCLIADSAPRLQRWAARRSGELALLHPQGLERLLPSISQWPRSRQWTAMEGLAEGLAGLRRVEPPEGWNAIRSALTIDGDLTVEQQRLLDSIDAVFGAGQSIERLAAIARDREASLAQRELALRTLIDTEAENLQQVCLDVLRERYLNRTALVGLTRFDDPGVAERIASDYRSFHLLDRPAVIDTLVTRRTFCEALLSAMERGRIPTSDVKTRHVQAMLRQLDAPAAERLRVTWESHIPATP
ncbi:MAG: hypothetical protein R3B96_18395 [Pirellulaceae bacterium]